MLSRLTPFISSAVLSISLLGLLVFNTAAQEVKKREPNQAADLEAELEQFAKSLERLSSSLEQTLERSLKSYERELEGWVEKSAGEMETWAEKYSAQFEKLAANLEKKVAILEGNLRREFNDPEMMQKLEKTVTAMVTDGEQVLNEKVDALRRQLSEARDDGSIRDLKKKLAVLLESQAQLKAKTRELNPGDRHQYLEERIDEIRAKLEGELSKEKRIALEKTLAQLTDLKSSVKLQSRRAESPQPEQPRYGEPSAEQVERELREKLAEEQKRHQRAMNELATELREAHAKRQMARERVTRAAEETSRRAAQVRDEAQKQAILAKEKIEREVQREKEEMAKKKQQIAEKEAAQKKPDQNREKKAEMNELDALRKEVKELRRELESLRGQKKEPR